MKSNERVTPRRASTDTPTSIIQSGKRIVLEAR